MESYEDRSEHASAPSRRKFLAGAGAAAAGAVIWSPVFRVTAASAQTTTAPPPDFPSSIPVYQQAYQNWSGMVVIDDVWTCTPASAQDVVTLANWAQAQGYRLRAQGIGHGWSPLVLPAGSTGAGYVLVNTTEQLTSVSISDGSPATVTAQPGVTMDTFVTTLAAAGYGLCAIPAPGDLTLGGVLAINGHGAAIPATGESPLAGQTYGSLSNLIVSLTAVVWNSEQEQYVLQTFQRSDPDIRAFLVHLGRAFITSVTLQVAASQNLRCQSWVDISAADLFAPPASAGSNSLASYANKTGRVEAIWFPFTDTPWLKVWTLASSDPLFSRRVTSPYNYSFTDVSTTENSALEAVVTSDPSGTPALEVTQIGVVDVGLVTTLSWDIWGQWQNVLRYVPATTERIVEAGFAILTSRANIQQVVSDFYQQYSEQLADYQGNGEYPMNGPIEIRVTGLDQPGDSIVDGAQSPILSSARPRPDHPEWNVVVWLDMGTLPVTPGYSAFYADMEDWIWSHYTGSYACVRPEWSKAWACTATAPWTDTTVLSSTIPDAVSAGQADDDDWNTAVSILTSYDPYSVFSNPFLDTLIQPA
ncbi:MAG: cholesterol oxidase substrate-binding domain-containing protein [Streptosporangiaceae bacterium]|jgi:FAD/FMN-containing dehydrogenase